ncbi:MAG TPA: M28 family peptidase [Vicinamibacterales bacterium]|nr:M28 family peptidase [Vicinamibacterales bacterium]
MTMMQRARWMIVGLLVAWCSVAPGAGSGGQAPTQPPAVQRQAPPQPAPSGPQPVTRAVQQERIDSPAVRASAGLDKLLPARAEAVYQALAAGFQPARAMEVVTFMDRYWRVAGNTGFNASLDHIKAGLVDAGFVVRPAAQGPSAGLWVEEYPSGGNGWEPLRFDVTMIPRGGGTPERVFDPVLDYIAICINSFSTPAGGVSAPLIYVGAGTSAADYASVDVKGAIVLGDGSTRGLWQEAIRARGAIGVISAAPPPSYTRPDESPEVFQWGSVPYDEGAKAFGFKASPLVARRLKERLRAGPVTLRVEVETTFNPSPGRILVAEIPGASLPGERIVMVAHVQEPGSNDNASGCGTLLELARSVQLAIAAGKIAAPARTLTFVWGDEMRASREWLRADAARPASTRYMVSLDMTGEDAAKTGGTFIIEKEPDPSAVWPRPSDPHTEWWGGNSYRGELKGSLLNDLLLAVCLRRARDTGWVVQANPYEGGSDHSIFLNAGVPSVLASHFTDRYYHTNLDRPDKTSPAEMAHVGIAVGTTAVLLASATEQDALAVNDLVADAARRRLDLEARQSAELLNGAADRAAAEAGERALRAAWTAWYARALESVLALPVTPASDALRGRVRAAVDALTRPEAGAGR